MFCMSNEYIELHCIVMQELLSKFNRKEHV